AILNRSPFFADFRRRKFVNPRTDVPEIFSSECELYRPVPQPRDGQRFLVESRLAQDRIVTSPVEADEDGVGPDLHDASGLYKTPVESFGTHVSVAAQLRSQPAITTISDHGQGRIQVDIQAHFTR